MRKKIKDPQETTLLRLQQWLKGSKNNIANYNEFEVKGKEEKNN